MTIFAKPQRAHALFRWGLWVIAAFSCALAFPATAQDYPTRPIRLIVPLPPGGSADALARPLAAKLGAFLKGNVVVENRPGGLTVIGADVVAKAPPDGYTLYLMPGTHVLINHMVKNVPFQPMTDFTPIVTIGFLPYIVMSNARQPYKTLGQMLDYAKANPEQVSIGVSNAVTRVAASALESAAKIKLTIVEYKGGGPVGTDLVGNQIATGVVAANLMPFVEQGKLVALAATNPTGIPSLPNIPTVAETIPGSNYDVQTWYAIVGPANLPSSVVDRLYGAIRAVLAEPEMRDQMSRLGMVAPEDISPAATLSLMKSYEARLGKLMQAAGITPQ